jgi:hypothetical protein
MGMQHAYERRVDANHREFSRLCRLHADYMRHVSHPGGRSLSADELPYVIGDAPPPRRDLMMVRVHHFDRPPPVRSILKGPRLLSVGMYHPLTVTRALEQAGDRGHLLVVKLPRGASGVLCRGWAGRRQRCQQTLWLRRLLAGQGGGEALLAFPRLRVTAVRWIRREDLRRLNRYGFAWTTRGGALAGRGSVPCVLTRLELP